MTLSITGNVVMDEEFRLLQADDNDSEVTALSADPALIAYLNSLNGSPDTGFPQYAEEDSIIDFGTASALALVADNTGAPFPTSGTGIATGFTDVDGNAISLFADPSNPSIILGKSADGDISFAIVLDVTLTGGVVTGAKVYIVEYEALFHTVAGSVDAADTHDLEGLVFVEATTTTTTTLDFSDFRDVASGQTEFAMIAPDQAAPGQGGAIQILATGVAPNGTHSTVNVSTQGGFNGSLGTGSQAVGVGESLIFDIVTGGDAVYTSQESHDLQFLLFDTHAEDVTLAEFGIVQTNPNNANVDVLLTAYNVKTAHDATDQSGFVTASLDPTTQDKVTITSVKITDDDGGIVADTSTNIANLVTFNADGTATLNNLKDDWLVEFATNADMDRFTVKNIGTGNEQFDIGRLSVTQTSSATAKEYADLGVHLIFEDDGPLATLAINADQFVVVDESIGQNPGEDEAASLGAVTVLGATLFTETIDYGADGADAAKSYALSIAGGDGTDSGLDDTATGSNIVLVKINDGLVEGRVGSAAGALALTVAVTSTGDVTLTQYRAVVHNDPNDHDEAGTSAATFLANTLQLSFSVKDGDLDPASSNTVDLGSILRLEDHGPSISTPANSIVAFADNASTGDVAITDAFGSDGAGLVSIINLPTGWVFDNADHTSASLSNSDGALFRLTVDNDSYNFTVLQDAPLTFNALDFSAIPSGSPQETLTVPTADPNEATTVTFNGLVFVDTANPLAPANNPGAASDKDDLNPDAVGFGVKNLQASQMNNNDGFFAQDGTWSGSNDAEINGIRFDVQAIGGTKTAHMEYWFVDDGAVVGGPHFQDLTNLPGGNNVLADVTIHSDTSFDQVYVRFFFDAPNINTKGIRLENFEIQTPNPVPDQVFEFGLRIEDKDSDFASTTTNFKVGVDGDGGGVIL